MINLIGRALAVSETEHLAHHAGDKIADAGDFSSGMMGNIGSMMGGLGSGWGWTWTIFMWIFWILILVALILSIVWLIKQIKK